MAVLPEPAPVPQHLLDRAGMTVDPSKVIAWRYDEFAPDKGILLVQVDVPEGAARNC